MEQSFNFDLFHKELEDTEHYLKSASDNVIRRSAASVRSSGDFMRASAEAVRRESVEEKVTERVVTEEAVHTLVSSERRGVAETVPGETPSSDSKNREELIQRLLADYNQRKSKPPRNYLDTPDEPKHILPESEESPASLLFAEHEGTPESEARPYDPYDTLFFASDVHGTSEPYSAAPFSLGNSLLPTVPSSALEHTEYSDDRSSPPTVEVSSSGYHRYAPHDNHEDLDLDMTSDSIQPRPVTSVTVTGGASDEFAETVRWPQPKSLSRDPSPQPRPLPRQRPISPHSDRMRQAELRRQETLQQLKQQAEERFAASHPFRPALHTHRSVSPARGRGVDGLYASHRDALRRREEVRRELAEIERLGCTFRPTLVARSRDLATRRALREQLDSHRSDPSTSRGSGEPEQVGDRLHALARDQSRRLHEQAVSLQAQALADCTFTPSLQPSTVHRATAAGRELPLHERLADVIRERQHRKEALRRQLEEERRRTAPFAPQLIPHVPPRERSPASASSPPPSASDPDGYVASLAQHRPVGERLNQQGLAMQRRKQRLLWEREQEVAAAMEAPTISAGSQRLLQAGGALRGAGLLQRQEAFLQQREARRAGMQQAEDEEREQWFHPQISSHSLDILSRKRPVVVAETLDERVERLCTGDQQKLRAHRQLLEDQILRELRFTPSIAPRSAAIGRPSSVQALHEDVRGKEAREQVRSRQEEETARTCTFAPQINSRSRQLVAQAQDDSYDQLFQRYCQQRGYRESEAVEASGAGRGASTSSMTGLGGVGTGPRINLKEPERMAAEIRAHVVRKEEARRQEIMLQEINALADCTFAPSLETKDYPRYRCQFEAPVLVPGLGRHMELQELTRRQKKEREQREKEVFQVTHVDRMRRPEDGSTIVKEFSFHLPVERSISREREHTR